MSKKQSSINIIGVLFTLSGVIAFIFSPYIWKYMCQLYMGAGISGDFNGAFSAILTIILVLILFVIGERLNDDSY